jgi:hypothetical protein
MNTAFSLGLFLLTLGVAGCTTQETVMVNDRGEELRCGSWGYGLGALAADSQQRDCVRDAEKRGYQLKHGE